MASNIDQNPSNLSILRSPPTRFPPHNLGHHTRKVEKVEVDSSSRRIRNRYKSAFTEIGLDGAADTTNCNIQNGTNTRPGSRVRWRSQVEIHETVQEDTQDSQQEISRTILPIRRHQYSLPAATLSRLSLVAVVLAIMIPILHMSPLLRAGPAIIGAEAGPISPPAARFDDLGSAQLLPRQSNPADTCLRWSHQSAIVNGTLYLYGGRAKTDSNQDSNTWSELISP